MTANAPAEAIDVCVPWRSQPDRVAAFQHVTALWRNAGFNVILGDSSPDRPFNLSRARNSAVEQATTDVVVVADADTVPDMNAVQTAIYACRRHGGVWYPFTTYHYLSATVTPGDDLNEAPAEQVYQHSVGGLFIIRRTDYWRLGGFDERFQGWGGEDTAFHLAASHLSTTHRIPGTVYAFNHTADRNMRGPWVQHMARYRQAARRGTLEQFIQGNRST